MHRMFLSTAIVSSFFVVGCAASQARLDALKDAASGTISDLKDTTNAVMDTVSEIDSKVKQVQSGANLIRKGVGELGEAL